MNLPYLSGEAFCSKNIRSCVGSCICKEERERIEQHESPRYVLNCIIGEPNREIEEGHKNESNKLKLLSA